MRTELLRQSFAAIGASEGTIWQLDETRAELVPIWNSGPNAKAFVETYRQPLSTGLISLVCVTEQALCENEVYRHAGQDPTLDRQLGVLTCAMIAVPLRLRGETIGVVSCVKLKADPEASDPPPFTAADLACVQEAVKNLDSE